MKNIITICQILFAIISFQLLQAKPLSNAGKIILGIEPTIDVNISGVQISLFSIRNVGLETAGISNATIRIESLMTSQSVATIIEPLGNFDILTSKSKIIYGSRILNPDGLNQLRAGVYLVNLEYSLNNTNYTLQLGFFRKLALGQLDTYQINKHTYQGLQIYALKGGMSAEYAVQKSLATLNGGISHTWDVRKKADGTLDLSGGGPVSVYSTPNFLQKAVEQTVNLYDTELGQNTNFDTVIISTGVPSAPYLSYYMGAPILPLHFLVSVNSFAEIKKILSTGNNNGYSCYATAGYDPSIEGEGVAWIKLLNLPDKYLEFINNHSVKNVIIMGAIESGYGETQAKRIEGTYFTSNQQDYAPSAIYTMTHGGSVGLTNMQTYYKDYAQQEFGDEINISDWESGITQTQINNFKTSIKNRNSSTNVYAIEGSESIGFYNISMDLSLKFMKKNASRLGSDPITGIAMNEYLIGYPAYESKVGQIPMLYWQMPGNQKNTAARVNNLLRYKISREYPNKNFYDIPIKFNAKYNRIPFVNALKEIGMTNVTQSNWQKADVWDVSDGLESPCELVAKDIVYNQGGASSFRNYISNLTKLTIEDLRNMVVNEETTSLNHPEPNNTANVASIPNAGLEIKRYEFQAQAYWDSREQPKEVAFYNYNSTTPQLLGWIDGYSKTGNERRQRITISQFDLNNTSDEFELKVGYKFHPKQTDGFKSYDANKGDEQNMDCFEYTRVPKTSWLDIPSRVMAREGAVWIVNGSVYDWDYNGLPGVVPFIKKNNVIKAQPQILSYKGEGAFAWNWGAQKSVSILARPKDVPESNLISGLSTLFHNQTTDYANVLGGMTFMHDRQPYDINDLQPQWMRDYPTFNSKYLGPSGTAIRCYLSNPDPEACVGVLERSWGSVEYAPDDEGWNNCSRLKDAEFVKRFSTLAYRQYDQLFERVPNARTYVAIKDNKLDIGIIDGDLGNFADARGVNYSKTFGMKNSEVSKFYQYKNYDKLINLDGGSSSQIWYNGRGPLHDWTGYPLVEDNQGPYYSRLVSSYLMLVPKKHTDQITRFKNTNNQYMILDNSELTFNYSDDSDHSLDKAFISLSPSKSLLMDASGLIAGNFKIENKDVAKGAILYYQGEDTYYEDTEGLRKVVPVMRNILIIGIGKIPEYVRNEFVNKQVLAGVGSNEELRRLLESNNQAFYLLKMNNGEITNYFFENESPFTKYIDNSWHSFMVYTGRGSANATHLSSYVDDLLINGSGARQINGGLFNMGGSTHAAIGMANIDGRFVTGNAKLAIDNFLFVNGSTALENIQEELNNIGSTLTTQIKLPSLEKYHQSNIYVLQFEETTGMHSFSAAADTNEIRLFALNLNTEKIKKTFQGLNMVNIPPGDYYIVDNKNQCLDSNREGIISWKKNIDNSGQNKWDLCSKINIEEVSMQPEMQINRIFKIISQNKYISIESNAFKNDIDSEMGIAVSNYALTLTDERTVLRPYQLELTGTTNGNQYIALTKGELSSFPYQMVAVEDVKQTSVNAGGNRAPISSSASTGKILGGVLGSGTAIGVGIGAGLFIKAKLTSPSSNEFPSVKYDVLKSEIKIKCE